MLLQVAVRDIGQLTDFALAVSRENVTHGKLNDKIAIVTGAGQGIGQAIAEKLAAEGAIVVVSDLDEATARDTAAALACAVAIRVDVTDRQHVQVMADRVKQQFGRVCRS